MGTDKEHVHHQSLAAVSRTVVIISGDDIAKARASAHGSDDFDLCDTGEITVTLPIYPSSPVTGASPTHFASSRSIHPASEDRV
jgi:hypothetical protein